MQELNGQSEAYFAISDSKIRTFAAGYRVHKVASLRPPYLFSLFQRDTSNLLYVLVSDWSRDNANETEMAREKANVKSSDLSKFSLRKKDLLVVSKTQTLETQTL